MVTHGHMPPMLEVERRMNTIKQLSKGDNDHQRLLDITQPFENNCSKNTIKTFM
jgi:hypothetical protein